MSLALQWLLEGNRVCTWVSRGEGKRETSFVSSVWMWGALELSSARFSRTATVWETAESQASSPTSDSFGVLTGSVRKTAADAHKGGQTPQQSLQLCRPWEIYTKPAQPSVPEQATGGASWAQWLIEGLGSLAKVGGVAGTAAGCEGGVPRINKYPIMKSAYIQRKPRPKPNSLLTFSWVNPECSNRGGDYEHEKTIALAVPEKKNSLAGWNAKLTSCLFFF